MGLLLLGGLHCLPTFGCDFRGLALTATIGQYGSNDGQMHQVLSALREKLAAKDPRLKMSLRLNTSHSNLEDVLPTLNRWYEVADRVGLPVTIMVDMPGPKMRVPKLERDIPLQVGQHFQLVPVHTGKGTWNNVDGQIPIPMAYMKYLQQLKPGEQLSFADGRIVMQKLGEGTEASTPFKVIELQAGVDTLSSRKGFNIPSVLFDNVVTNKDRQLLWLSYWSGRVPVLAASFVQTKADLVEIQTELKRAKSLVDQVLAVEMHTQLDPENLNFVNEDLAQRAHQMLFPHAPHGNMAEMVRDLHGYFTKHRPIEPIVEAKLERPIAVDNAAEISEIATIPASAQGDLGIEVTLPRLKEYTDRVVATARKDGMPSKVATRLFMGLLEESPRITTEEKARVEELLANGNRFFQVSDETTVDFDEGQGGPIPNYQAILNYLGSLNKGPTPPKPDSWIDVTVGANEAPRDVFLRYYRQAQESATPLGLRVDHPLLGRMLDYLPNVVVEAPPLPKPN